MNNFLNFGMEYYNICKVPSAYLTVGIQKYYLYFSYCQKKQGYVWYCFVFCISVLRLLRLWHFKEIECLTFSSLGGCLNSQVNGTHLNLNLLTHPPKTIKIKQIRDQQTYFVKEQIENILGFVSHRISVITNLFCYCIMKAVIKNA